MKIYVANTWSPAMGEFILGVFDNFKDCKNQVIKEMEVDDIGFVEVYKINSTKPWRIYAYEEGKRYFCKTKKSMDS